MEQRGLTVWGKKLPVQLDVSKVKPGDLFWGCLQPPVQLISVVPVVIKSTCGFTLGTRAVLSTCTNAHSNVYIVCTYSDRSLMIEMDTDKLLKKLDEENE